MNKTLVVQWSQNKNDTQIDSVDEMLKSNLMCIEKKIPSDYIPIGFASTPEEATKLAEKFEKSLVR